MTALSPLLPLPLTPETVSTLLAAQSDESDVLSWLSQLQPEVLTPQDWLLLAQGVRNAGQAMAALPFDAMDVCGTGGSGVSSLNTSTMVALALAAMPESVKNVPPVVKFGNRAVSSKSGSFNFLEALGIAPTALNEVPAALEKNKVAFVYAPDTYPGLARLQVYRKQLAKPTAFNSLGPLLNPFLPSYQLMGISNVSALNAFPDVLPLLNPRLHRGLLVRSQSGLDELHPWEPATLRWVSGDLPALKLDRKFTTLWPFDEHPLPQAPDFSTLTAADNARLWQAMAEGSSGVVIENSADSALLQIARAMVALNAGAALWLCQSVHSLEEGLELALGVLASGDAWALSQRLARLPA
ncbi:MAG: hypothetical protein VKJ06_02640 [Vampirovibrionales bacterium]|nr:hypothetical protein [Vampirovibrionales bacterium]